MIKKHITSSLVKSMNSDELLSVFEETDNLITQFKEIWNALCCFENGELDEDDLMDTLDDYSVVNCNTLKTFSTCCCSKYDVMNCYLGQTMEELANLQGNLTLIVSSCCVPTSNEFTILKDSIFKVISGCVFFLLHEFELLEICVSENLEQIDFDEVFKAFVDKTGDDPRKRAWYYYLTSKTFKLKLEIFDEYPDKEEKFEVIMGPHLVGIDVNNLTIELVEQVIAGDVTPEELCVLTNKEV